MRVNLSMGIVHGWLSTFNVIACLIPLPGKPLVQLPIDMNCCVLLYMSIVYVCAVLNTSLAYETFF